MKNIKAIGFGILLAIFGASSAFAQCSGQSPASTYCGNPTGSQALPGWKPFSSMPFPNIAGGTVVGNRGTSGAQAVPLTNPILGIPGVSNGQIGFASSAGGAATIAGSGAGAITLTGSLTINPTAASLNPGFNISQTSPVGGSFAGPISFNTINVVDQGITVTGSGVDAYGLAATNMVGLRVNYSSAGGPIRGGMIAAYRATASNPGSYYGFAGSIYTNVTGVGLLWGNIGVAQIGTSGSASLLIGLEGEVAVYGSGTVNQRIAVSANTQGPVAASTALDAAFGVSAGGGSGGAAPFKKMFAISKNLFGSAPLDTTGDIFWSDVPLTVANVFNLSNMTLTGNFADFPTFGINGATGQASFGLPISTIAAAYSLQVSAASSGTVAMGVAPAGSVTGASFVEIRNSTIAAQLVVLANEAARTTVRYGLTLGNNNEITAFAGNGLIVGTNNAAPLILGTNNVIRSQIASSGCFSVGNTVDCGVPGVINLLTGLRIGNAAASGNVLRGNGTNFVSTALVVSDLSNLGANVGTWLVTPSGANLSAALTTPLTISGGGTGIATGPGTPNFKAFLTTSVTGFASGSTQKINFDTVVFDTGSYWSAVNHKYTPLVAGTYRVCFTFVPATATWLNQADAVLGIISKNGTFGGGGSTVFLGVFPSFAAIAGDTAAGSGCTLTAMNGSTDTLEIDANVSTSGSTWSIAGSANMATQVAIDRIGP